MAKNIKKSLCLLLTVTMIATLFIGCGKKESGPSAPKAQLNPMDDTKSVELTYFYWEDEHIVNSLAEGWAAAHPNAKLTTHMTTTDTNNQDILLHQTAYLMYSGLLVHLRTLSSRDFYMICLICGVQIAMHRTLSAA